LNIATVRSVGRNTVIMPVRSPSAKTKGSAEVPNSIAIVAIPVPALKRNRIISKERVLGMFFEKTLSLLIGSRLFLLIQTLYRQLLAKPSLSSRERAYRLPEVILVEVRPVLLCKIEFRVSGLPWKEARKPHLPGCPDYKVYIWKCCSPQVILYVLLIYL